ncbi:MAG: hypothetical protein NTY19_08080 [Planctomycetota bacterium]|nr:hypothetical protein [Planctomycetota bacterium]
MHAFVLDLAPREWAAVLGIIVLACVAGGFLAAAVSLPRAWCWLAKHAARATGHVCTCLVMLLAAQGRITTAMVQESGEQLARDVSSFIDGWTSFVGHQDEGEAPTDEATSRS